MIFANRTGGFFVLLVFFWVYVNVIQCDHSGSELRKSGQKKSQKEDVNFSSLLPRKQRNHQGRKRRRHKDHISGLYWIQREAVRHFKKRPSLLMSNRRRKALRRKKKTLPVLLPLMSSASKRFSRRPNIILMMADDQDVELGSLQFMPKLNRYLREGGAHFRNGFVTTPMCCPSRSSMLTGLYSHNHHVLTNNDNCSSTEWVRQHEPRTFAKYLNEAGYTTGYFGKYLNKYNGNHIPQGWDEWCGLVRNSRFYNYTLNVNGNKVRHGWDYTKDYFPDLITNDSLAFFRQSKQRQPHRPILMVMSYPGPHGPEDSAPQYADLFFNVTTHHTPAYDYAPNPDKQWILQVTDRMEPVHKKFTDLLMTKRLQTLQSIDEAIERLYYELDSLGELDNTYIFYTSDHGYHLGQFGLVKGKAFPFDVDTKVPFFVRGPNIDGGTVKDEPVLNIDLAPTFLDIGGVRIPPHMDGKSILPVVGQSGSTTRNSTWRNAFLLERGKMTTHRYQKISGSVMNEIPTFANGSVFVPKPMRPKQQQQHRLAVACLKPRFQAPCQLFQRRKCVKKKNGEWRMVACHSSALYKDNKKSWLQPDLCPCEAAGGNGERRLQRQFIARHTANKPARKMRHKFLRELSNSSWRPALKSKRAAADLLEKSADLLEKSADFIEKSADLLEKSADLSEKSADQLTTDVLKEIAEEEIDEVDIIMEDISEEIHDLQLSISDNSSTAENGPGSEFQCQVVNGKGVNCSSAVYSDQVAWRSSRTYINEQIRRLRSQLMELKEIRKHLKIKRPVSQHHHVVDWDYATESDTDFDSKVAKCKCSAKQLREKQRSKLRDLRRSRREKLKLARLRRRMRRKEQRQRRKEKRQRKEKRKKKLEMCNNDERMNCFSHNNDHWKTKPLWTDGSFCACTNSNTNTYWCVRNVNSTHNYLYCEFVSGSITYYNLNVDPYQLRNIYQTLSDNELNFMHQQLSVLKDQGTEHSQQQHKASRSKRPSKTFHKRYGPFLPPPEAYGENR